MAGTEAAANLVLDDATMRPVLELAKSRQGELRPAELLIETRSLEAQALPAQIVCRRFQE